MKKFYCPANAWDCPYWKKDMTCALADEGCDPVDECDDAYAFWGDDPDHWADEDDEGGC